MDIHAKVPETGRPLKNGRIGSISRASTLPLYIMLLPAVILVLIYNYFPMVGIVIAFQKFNIAKGLFGSPWIGFQNFENLLKMEDTLRVVRNTFMISLGKIVTMFFIPVMVSILLNEIRRSTIKRSVQTIIYLPYFISWVILAGVLKETLASEGLVNSFLALFGVEPVFFLGSKEWFPVIVILTHAWKEFGFSTIVFLAAITGIDPALYEASTVDGASRAQQAWHITLPGMKPIIVLTLVLSLGQVLNAGFEQIFNLYSVQTYETGDILDTFVYRLSFRNAQYDIATAVGLFKSAVSFVFVSASYWLAYKVADYRVF